MLRSVQSIKIIEELYFGSRTALIESMHTHDYIDVCC